MNILPNTFFFMDYLFTDLYFEKKWASHSLINPPHFHHHPNPLAVAMDRVQLLLVGLPLLLFFSDVVNLFSPPPRPTPPPPHHPRPAPRSVPTHTLDFPLEVSPFPSHPFDVSIRFGLNFVSSLFGAEQANPYWSWKHCDFEFLCLLLLQVIYVYLPSLPSYLF